MKDLIIYSVAAFALSWILADSKISLPFRSWLARPSWANFDGKNPMAIILLALIECVACTGFHIGWIAQLLGFTPISSWWLAALYTCGFNLLLAKYIGMLDPE